MKIVFDKNGDHREARAFRPAEIIPDKQRVYKHDKYLRKLRKNILGSNIYTIILLGLAIFTIIQGASLILSIGICVATVLCFFVSMSGSDADERMLYIYEESSLYPAIIVGLNPVKLLILVKVTQGGDNCKWGVTTVTVDNLPADNPRIGSRVPCSVLYGPKKDKNTKLCNDIEVHPIYWATGNIAIINNSINRIDRKEWAFLEELKAKQIHILNFVYFNADFRRLKL